MSDKSTSAEPGEDLVTRARIYATEMHERLHHRRKYTLQPYQEHLAGVAALVASITSDYEMVAAAWLHDTVEDTAVTFNDLNREFGPEVMRLVMELTDISRPSDGNRAVRKAIDLHHLAQASTRGQTIKLADIIENTIDICRHDQRFAKIYLTEGAALLSVLRDGHPRLYRHARELIESHGRKLDIALPDILPLTVAESGGLLENSPALQDQFLRFRRFIQNFSARDILEPLHSFDAGIDAERVRHFFEHEGVALIGIRQKGMPAGYITPEDEIGTGAVLFYRPFLQLQIVPLEAPLTDVIHVLSRFAHCFIRIAGEIIGVITRADIEKPLVRMWLFGIIMQFEIVVTTLVKERWPQEEWREFISAGRLAKAAELMEERRRRKIAGGDLFSCLQLSDKLRVAGQIEDFYKKLGYQSLGAAKKMSKEFEALRNNLAHGQDITVENWRAILRLARRIDAEG